MEFREFKFIAKAEYLYTDEYYGPWFKCPWCGNRNIIGDSKFCNQCGKEVEAVDPMDSHM